MANEVKFDPTASSSYEADEDQSVQQQRAPMTRDQQDAAVVAGQQPRKINKPKILQNVPDLGPEDQSLLEKHRMRRVGDNEVKDNSAVMGYYEAMAKLNPNTDAYEAPAHTYVPMPAGGLDQIVRQHLGRRLDDPEDADHQTKQKYAQWRQDYDATFEKYRHLLFTLNADSMRTPDQTTVGQMVRVPTEFE